VYWAGGLNGGLGNADIGMGIFISKTMENLLILPFFFSIDPPSVVAPHPQFSLYGDLIYL